MKRINYLLWSSHIIKENLHTQNESLTDKGNINVTICGARLHIDLAAAAFIKYLAPGEFKQPIWELR